MPKNARQYFSRANTDFETAFCGTRRRSYVDLLRRVLESNDLNGSNYQGWTDFYSGFRHDCFWFAGGSGGRIGCQQCQRRAMKPSSIARPIARSWVHRPIICSLDRALHLSARSTSLPWHVPHGWKARQGARWHTCELICCLIHCHNCALLKPCCCVTFCSKLFFVAWTHTSAPNIYECESTVLHMTWEGGWDYEQTIFDACGLGTWPHHTTPHHIHYTISIYTPPLIQKGPKPGPAKITLQTASYIWRLFCKVGLSLQRGDIDVNTSHTKSQLFLQIFTCISDFAHFFGRF